MKPRILFAFVLLPVFAAAGEAVDRDFSIEVQPEGLNEKFNFKAKNIFKHAEYLASEICDGRLAGSPGEAKAREYIIERLKNAGFDEVRSFPFDFVGDVRLGKENSLKRWESYFDMTGGSYARLLEDFKPFAISDSGEVKASTTTGRRGVAAVFVGYGISAPDKGYDDYADVDVKDKIVLAFRGEPETPDGRKIGSDKPNPHGDMSVYSDLFYKAGVARDKGAKALLILDGTREELSKEKGTSLDLIRGGGRRHCGLPLIKVSLDWAKVWDELGNWDALKLSINKRLRPQSYLLIHNSFDLKVDILRERAIDQNLAVVIPGADPALKDEIVVIGAHYDHLGHGNEFSLADKADMGKIHPGADDNASGVSSVLEIAAALRRNRANLKRTVWIMFFGAEEMGTLGSNHFIQSPPDDFKVHNAAAMLNLDMVGRCREKKVMVYGVATGTGLDAVLKRANEGLDLKVVPTADGFGGSDQTAFVTAGIPVLFFFTGSHQDYHKPGDTADKLNVADQALVTALAYKSAVALINAPERPRFVKVDAPRMGSGMGGIRLGTLPDYAYEGKGLRLSGVRDGSPADKAGLKAGDILIRLGNRNIENIYDYMNALKQSQAGVETPLTLLRDGKELELKVVPEKRE